MKIPASLNYDDIHGLSNELKEKLAAVKPASLGQASRIDGMTPFGHFRIDDCDKSVGQTCGFCCLTNILDMLQL